MDFFILHIIHLLFCVTKMPPTPFHTVFMKCTWAKCPDLHNFGVIDLQKKPRNVMKAPAHFHQIK